MKENKMIWEAKGDYPFKFYIEKAVVVDNATGRMYVSGIASTTNVDHDNERMSKEAILSMCRVVNETGVPLRIQHNLADNAIVGKVFKATVDDRNQLMIEAELDANHPVVPFVYSSLKDGMKMGFSVGGKVKSAVREFVESKGKAVKTFYNIELQEVSLTPKPSNFDAWCVAKSITKTGENSDQFLESPFYTEYLYENQQLDYIQSFAKAIPGEGWKKVDIIKENKQDTMTDETKETKKAEEADETKTKASDETKDETKKASEETDETKKFVSLEMFKSFTELVSDGFASLSKAMESRAMDQAGPDEVKDDLNGPDGEAAKSADDETKDETKKASGRTGQTDPGPAAQGSDLGGTREKSSSSSTKKKADSEKDTYEMDPTTKSMTASIARINALKTKTVKTADETDETKKAEDKDETTTKSQVTSVDEFAKGVADVLDAMDAKFEKSDGKGYRFLGQKQAFIDALRNDKEFQEEIAKSMKLPGFKKSVSFGVPYTQDRSGKRFALVPAGEAATTISKSQEGQKQDFKTMYKSEFSTLKDNA